jgi:hypothetical protein
LYRSFDKIGERIRLPILTNEQVAVFFDLHFVSSFEFAESSNVNEPHCLRNNLHKVTARPARDYRRDAQAHRNGRISSSCSWCETFV